MQATFDSFAKRPHSISGFRGAPDTIRAMIAAVQGPRGEQSMVVRHAVDELLRGMHPKNYLGEIVAVRNWVAEKVRYANDPLHVELVKDPQRLVEEVVERGHAVGDCDDMASLIGTMGLQIGRIAQICAVGFGAPGKYSHVFARIQEPKTKTWIVCDPVAGTRERAMLSRIATYEVWSLDELPSKGPVMKG